MDKPKALKMLIEKWAEVEPEYGTVTYWMKANKVNCYTVEAVTKVLKRKQPPTFLMAMKLGDFLGMSRNELKTIAACYDEKLFADLLSAQDIPTPELNLAVRIFNIEPRKREVLINLIELLEEEK